MNFFTGYKTKHVHNSIHLTEDASRIWTEITNVMVSKFNFPVLFKLLGIPKPLSAKVIKQGVGGYRVARFSNDAQFHQEILEWNENQAYKFKFNPSKNFRVGHFLNLTKGPFQIETGSYHLIKNENDTNLILSSNYKIKGFFGILMHLPFRAVVYSFQRYLLKGIKKNLHRN